MKGAPVPVLVASALLAMTAQTSPETAGVYLIGSLHGLHADEPAFDFDRLGRLLDAIAPETLVLEVTPEELAGRSETRGRPEYPRVVWPWLSARAVEAEAMEPGGDRYRQMTTAASAIVRRVVDRDATVGELWAQYQAGNRLALLAYWQDMQSTQDARTAVIASAQLSVQDALFGSELTVGQEQWDTFMSDRAVATVLANPDRRVVVLCGYGNRYRFEHRLRQAAGDRMVEIERWPRVP